MKAFGYIRVSTLDQADSGLGLQAQRDAIDRDFAARWGPQGFEWGGRFEDPAVSGKKQFLTRPAGLQMSAAAGEGDVMLFAKLDRAFRSTVDCLLTLEVWRKRKIRVVFLDFNLDTDTAVGEFTLTVMAAAARLELRRLSERTKEGLAVARSKGRRGGGPLMTIKHERDAKGNIVRYVRPDVFALGLKVVEWRNRGVSWEAIRCTLRDQNIQRPKSNIISKFKESDWWRETAIKNLHRATVITQMWLSQGKAKWPKGWAKPDTLEVKDTTGSTKG